MNPFAAFFALCLLALSQARPGYEHGGNIQLEGVPNESHYGKLTYPKFDVIDLGTSIKDTLPPSVVTISKHETVKIPQPYPVKVPYPVPHPVPVAKPYPVIQTKFIKVPHPVPVEIVKKVPVPIEVPKPYPVPHEEFGHGGLQHLQEGGEGGGEEHGFDGGFGAAFDHLQGGGYGGEHAQADQSAGYEAVAQAQQGQWSPVQGGEEAQQQEEQH